MIGVMATFVVIGNYAQVIIFENKIKREIRRELNEVNKELHDEIVNVYLFQAHSSLCMFHYEMGFVFCLFAIERALDYNANHLDEVIGYLFDVFKDKYKDRIRSINAENRDSILKSIRNTESKSKKIKELESYILSLNVELKPEQELKS